MIDQQKSLYLGTSGLVLPYKNKMHYPPHLEGQSRISVYSTLFNSIEINSIFYKLPRPATIGQWTESVGPDFRYTFKLWKQITHCPALDFDQADVKKYFEVIAPAITKAGCLLIQFPPSVSQAFLRKVNALLSCIKKIDKNNWPIAVEFRSRSWYNDATYEMLNRYQAAMVYHDKKGSESPQPDLDSDIIYLRFHGPGGDYKGSYDEGLLYEYAGYVNDWRRLDKTVYVYFNNTMGNAIANLQTLERNL